MDKLIVTGLGNLDGEYECDLAGMLSLGSPETLTNREGHRIKLMAGVRAGEFDDALQSGDNDFLVALAAVVLRRNGKTFDDDRLWDARMGSGLEWQIEEREEVEDSPPAVAPPQVSNGTSGGGSSSPTSGHQGNDQSPTGNPSSATRTSGRGSGPATSVT